eukprot:SAG11_NODE_5315_length_1599_cov_0.970000_2_plen_83_part_00
MELRLRSIQESAANVTPSPPPLPPLMREGGGSAYIGMRAPREFRQSSGRESSARGTDSDDYVAVLRRMRQMEVRQPHAKCHD